MTDAFELYCPTCDHEFLSYKRKIVCPDCGEPGLKRKP